MSGKSMYVRVNVVWIIVLVAVVLVAGMAAQHRIEANGGDECRKCEQVRWPRYTICKDCFDYLSEAALDNDETLSVKPVLNAETAQTCVESTPDPEAWALAGPGALTQPE